MSGRKVFHARGKVLGGSSSINGMIFQRGNPLDFERWAADKGMGSWDYAHCLPYFKRMETCLAGADAWRGGSGPLVLERGPADEPAVRRVLRGRAAGRTPAHRRRERLPPGGLRRLRPQRAPRPPAQRRPRLPAPGDVAPQPPRGDPGDGDRSRARRRPRDRGRLPPRRVAATVASRRTRSSCAAARSTPRSCCCSPGSGRRRTSRSSAIDVVADLPGVGQQPAGPPRGLHPVRVQAAGLDRPLAQAPAQATDRRRVALPASWRGRLQPLRGRRLHPQQRRRRVPEPDVPLPPDRHPVRRLPPGRRARLPGAHRPDVLRRTRHRQAEVARPASSTRRCSSTTSPPRTTAASGSRWCGPPGTSSTSPPSRRSTPASCRPGPPSRPTRRSSTGSPRTPRPRCTPRAPRRWAPTTTSVLDPDDDAGPRCRRPAGRRRLVDALRHQRQHLRPGDDARREGRRPDPGQHPARRRGRAVLPHTSGDSALPSGRQPQRCPNRPTHCPARDVREPAPGNAHSESRGHRMSEQTLDKNTEDGSRPRQRRGARGAQPVEDLRAQGGQDHRHARMPTSLAPTSRRRPGASSGSRTSPSTSRPARSSW